MREITQSRVVAATPEQLWPALVEPDRFAEWFAFCDECQMPDPDTRVLIGSWGPQRSAVTVQITERDEPNRFAYQHVQEALDGRSAGRPAISTSVEFVLTPQADGGTEVTITSRQAPNGLGARVMMRLFGGRAVKGMLEQSLEMLGHEDHG